MPSRPALAALVALLALPATAGAAPSPSRPAAAPAAPAASRLAPTLHLSVGTGVCAAAHSDLTQVDNPCWLQFGLAPAVRVGGLELGLAYEGRELVKLLTFTLVQPPAVTSLGVSASLVHEPSVRWRVSAGVEGGWRHYSDFAGSGIRRREGAIDVPYLGAVGRAALGLRPQSGRADRLEVSVALRSDLETGHDTVGPDRWTAGGWSITMGLGLVSEW